MRIRGKERVHSGLLAFVLLALGAASCGENEPVAEFTASNRQGFLAACAQPLEDPRLLNDLCRCVIDRAEADLDFQRFAALDDELQLDSAAALPDDVVDIVSDCYIEYSGLAEIGTDRSR